MNQTSIPELDIFYAVIYFTTFFLGALLNVAAFWYFLKEPRNIAVILYRFISFNDILICLWVLPLALTSATHKKPVLFTLDAVCTTWPYVWSIIVKVSVFLVSVLSVTRMLRILNPFLLIPNKVVFVILIAGVLFHIAMSGFMQFTARTIYDPLRGWCRVVPRFFKIGLAFFNISMMVPVLLLAITSLVSVIVLYRHVTKSAASGGSTRELAIQSSITIQIFTFLYLICNIPMAVQTVIAMTNREKIRRPTIGQAYAYEASFVVSVAVNSLLNPIIYVVRMNSFKKFFTENRIVQRTLSTWTLRLSST